MSVVPLPIVTQLQKQIIDAKGSFALAIRVQRDFENTRVDTMFKATRKVMRDYPASIEPAGIPLLKDKLSIHNIRITVGEDDDYFQPIGDDVGPLVFELGFFNIYFDICQWGNRNGILQNYHFGARNVRAEPEFVQPEQPASRLKFIDSRGQACEAGDRSPEFEARLAEIKLSEDEYNRRTAAMKQTIANQLLSNIVALIRMPEFYKAVECVRITKAIKWFRFHTFAVLVCEAETRADLICRIKPSDHPALSDLGDLQVSVSDNKETDEQEVALRRTLPPPDQPTKIIDDLTMNFLKSVAIYYLPKQKLLDWVTSGISPAIAYIDGKSAGPLFADVSVTLTIDRVTLTLDPGSFDTDGTWARLQTAHRMSGNVAVGLQLGCEKLEFLGVSVRGPAELDVSFRFASPGIGSSDRRFKLYAVVTKADVTPTFGSTFPGVSGALNLLYQLIGSDMVEQQLKGRTLSILDIPIVDYTKIDVRIGEAFQYQLTNGVFFAHSN